MVLLQCRASAFRLYVTCNEYVLREKENVTVTLFVVPSLVRWCAVTGKRHTLGRGPRRVRPTVAEAVVWPLDDRDRSRPEPARTANERPAGGTASSAPPWCRIPVFPPPCARVLLFSAQEFSISRAQQRTPQPAGSTSFFLVAPPAASPWRACLPPPDALGRERTRAHGTRSVHPLGTAASPSPIGRLLMEHRHSGAQRSTRRTAQRLLSGLR